jgi:nucleotide-binding universal stress UspA family protein
VHDALPLIAKDAKVTVVAVNPHETGEHGPIPCADLCLHLARHGLKAEAVSLTAPDSDAGDVMLARAFDEGCDLLVMGAYGHSRMREFVFGGVTSHVLDSMTLPVLMSH